MAQLRRAYHLFASQDTELVVIGPDAAEAFRNYWAKERLPFLGLPDPKHSVLRRYGQQVSLFKLGRMPAQVIIDKQGILRYAHYGHSMSDIPNNRDLLRMLEDINRTDPDGAKSTLKESVGMVN